MTPISFESNSVALLPLTVILSMHAGALGAVFLPSVSGFVSLLVLYLVSGLGITVGYHRMLSHRSFRAGTWTARALCTAGALALQGGPGNWVAMHRLHHAYSDTAFDPHNALRGFFHAHLRWTINKLPEPFLRVRYTHVAKDVVRDPYLRWLGDHHYLINVVVGSLLFWIGGLSALLWGICLRITLVHHATWLVNSASHVWGSKPYSDAPGRNNALVAVLSMGEGWHNNHHAYPRSARLGFTRTQVDVGWWLIALMRRCRLVDQVRVKRSGSSGVARLVSRKAHAATNNNAVGPGDQSDGRNHSLGTRGRGVGGTREHGAATRKWRDTRARAARPSASRYLSEPQDA